MGDILPSGKKKCPACNKTKDVGEFYLRHGRKDQVQSYCIACCKVRKKREKNTFVRGNENRRCKQRKLLVDYLREHPCIDCGEADPIVLDFDHRNHSAKIAAVTSMALRGFSADKIRNEIAKCDIRCSNCHRRKTARELNSYRWQLVNG